MKTDLDEPLTVMSDLSARLEAAVTPADVSPWAEMGPGPGRSNRSPRPLRILVLDDDESNRVLHTMILVRAGHHVEAAADGEAGWDRLAAGSYDLLITDIEMPRLTGLQLIDRMRRVGLATPVIVVSGSMDSVGPAAFAELNLTAVLPKPFHLPELLDVVDGLLAPGFAAGHPPVESPRVCTP